jgi:hypothetical protein
MSPPDLLARLTSPVVRNWRVCARHVLAGAALLATCVATTAAEAQSSSRVSQRRHQPLSQHSAPGVAARWATLVNRKAAHKPQPVRVDLPDGIGQVAFFQGGTSEELPIPEQNLAVLHVGSLYRFKISDLAAHPGVELYPTIELIDKLHPPCGRENEFPVPVAFTSEEIAEAVKGRLVTKVIYVERPDHALPSRGNARDRAYLAEPNENVLELAQRDGRPVAIVRLGGRTPDLARPEPGFYGDPAPIAVVPEVIGLRQAGDFPEVLP